MSSSVKITSDQLSILQYVCKNFIERFVGFESLTFVEVTRIFFTFAHNLLTQSFIEKFDLEVDENKAELLSSSVEITRDQSFIEKFDFEVDENKSELLSSSVEITRDQTPIGEFHLTTSTSDFRYQQKLDFLFHVLKFYQKRLVSWHIKEMNK